MNIVDTLHKVFVPLTYNSNEKQKLYQELTELEENEISEVDFKEKYGNRYYKTDNEDVISLLLAEECSRSQKEYLMTLGSLMIILSICHLAIGIADTINLFSDFNTKELIKLLFDLAAIYYVVSAVLLFLESAKKRLSRWNPIDIDSLDIHCVYDCQKIIVTEDIKRDIRYLLNKNITPCMICVVFFGIAKLIYVLFA